MDIFIVVKLTFEGIHNWPSCPIPEVSFLKSPHRHVFHVKAIKKVSHSDRDQEIIVMKREMLNFITSNYGHPAQLGSMSCEQIAEVLVSRFQLSECEVLEDDENGAIVKIQ